VFFHCIFQLALYSHSYKGGVGLLRHSNDSHIEALIKAYPELNLKRENFWHRKKGIASSFLLFFADI
jgi:hypothetical protein